MIGLVDLDLQTSTSINLAPPNLEIMKLATYYRLEENTFCRLISLDEQDLTIYDKIYFFSEQESQPQIPFNFLQTDNVIFGGTAFTNGIYKPFENSIIDYTLPRPAIYKEYLKQKYNDGIKTKVISHILDDTYYRCYAGDNKLPIPAIQYKKRVFIYDKDIFYPDWENIIQSIANRQPSSITCIHPIICKTLTQYFTIRKFPKMARTNKIILDLNIPLTEVDYMFKEYKHLFLEDITQSSNIYLSLGGNFNTSFQYYKDYIYKLNLLYAFWCRNIPIKIYYIQPRLGITDKLAPLSLLTEVWSRNLNKQKTLREKFTFKTKKESPSKDAYELLIKFYPTAKDLFDQTFNDLKNRRYWIL